MIAADTWLRADLIAQPAAAADEPVQLAASQCTQCGRVHFPRREQCPACNANAAPTALQGTATLGPCTAVLHAPPGAQLDVPYLVGVAQFAEGISIMGVIVGATQTPPQGTPLQTVAMALPDGRLTYAFRVSTT